MLIACAYSSCSNLTTVYSNVRPAFNIQELSDAYLNFQVDTIMNSTPDGSFPRISKCS